MVLARNGTGPRFQPAREWPPRHVMFFCGSAIAKSSTIGGAGSGGGSSTQRTTIIHA